MTKRAKKKTTTRIKIDFKAPLEVLETYKSNDLRKIADYQLRQYLLHNARRNGLGQVECFISKKFFNEGDLHVAHLIQRAKMCTRWDLKNCHLVNKWSNTFDDTVLPTPRRGRR